MNNKSIWLPHLILQRNLGVKDLSKANFEATLIEHSLGGLPKTWQPKLDGPNLQDQVQSLTGPNLTDKTINQLDTVRDRLKRGVHASQLLDRGARPVELVDGIFLDDKKTNQSLLKSVPLRGEPVYFELLGYKTFLFETEYALIKDVVKKVEEITIQVTYGLSPLFKIFAKLKN